MNIIIKTIKPKQGHTTNLVFQGDLLEGFSYGLNYSFTPLLDAELKSVNKLTNLLELGLSTFGADKAASLVGEYKDLGLSRDTTRMTGGFPDHLSFSVVSRLPVIDRIDAVYNKIKILQEISTPAYHDKLWKIVKQSKSNLVSVTIGDFFQLDEAVITGVTYSHAKTYLKDETNFKVPAWVDLTIGVTSNYMADWDLVKKTSETEIRTRKRSHEYPASSKEIRTGVYRV